jgi:hypothetical protein
MKEAPMSVDTDPNLATWVIGGVTLAGTVISWVINHLFGRIDRAEIIMREQVKKIEDNMNDEHERLWSAFSVAQDNSSRSREQMLREMATKDDIRSLETRLDSGLKAVIRVITGDKGAA